MSPLQQKIDYVLGSLEELNDMLNSTDEVTPEELAAMDTLMSALEDSQNVLEQF